MLKKLSQKRNKRGFTLVELIVVIAILGILMAIAVPRFVGFRDSAAMKADKATAANIGKAAELYLVDPPTIDAIAQPTIAELYSANLIDQEKPKPKHKDNGEEFIIKYGVNSDKPLIEVLGTKEGSSILYPEPNL